MSRNAKLSPYTNGSAAAYEINAIAMITHQKSGRTHINTYCKLCIPSYFRQIKVV